MDSGLNAVTTMTMVLADSREDSHLQAILKFHHPISLGYKAYHRLPVKDTVCVLLFFVVIMQHLLHTLSPKKLCKFYLQSQF